MRTFRNFAAVAVLVGLAVLPPEIWAATRKIKIEAETGTGQGIETMPRSKASNRRTARLESGEQIAFEVRTNAKSYAIKIVYSNDSLALVGETVTVSIDGQPVGSFIAEGSSNFGNNWNVFLKSPTITTPKLTRGLHTLVLSVTNGDFHGIEFDYITLKTLS